MGLIFSNYCHLTRVTHCTNTGKIHHEDGLLLLARFYINQPGCGVMNPYTLFLEILSPHIVLSLVRLACNLPCFGLYTV